MPKIVEIEFYGAVECIDTYTGRLLGVIGNKEYYAIITDKSIATKVLTGESVSLCDVADILEREESSDKFRVIIATKTRDGKSIRDCLFITPRISELNYYNAVGATEIGTCTEKYDWLIIREED